MVHPTQFGRTHRACEQACDWFGLDALDPRCPVGRFLRLEDADLIDGYFDISDLRNRLLQWLLRVASGPLTAATGWIHNPKATFTLHISGRFRIKCDLSMVGIFYHEIWFFLPNYRACPHTFSFANGVIYDHEYLRDEIVGIICLTKLINMGADQMGILFWKHWDY